jgi:hypothetical protein
MKGFKALAAKLRLEFVPEPPQAVPYDCLKDVHERRFGGSDIERSVRLRSEIASICKISPTEMHEDDRLDELCPPWHFWRFVEPSQRLENLEAFILAESRKLARPKRPLDTAA